MREYGIVNDSYFLSIARLEPENNLEMMLEAYILSKVKTPYYIVGNHLTSYGDYLKDKYRNKGVIFLGKIFNKFQLDNLRSYCKLYIHGHSVGGTNPALLEAMAAKSLIAAHNNQFNNSVLGEDAFYFSSSDELSLLFTDQLEDRRSNFIVNNLKKIEKNYRWGIIVDQYEVYFQKILNTS